MSLLNTALAYRDAGYSIVPVAAGTKRPAIKWTEYQERMATDAELSDWFDRQGFRGLGIVTGRISGLWVLDCDPAHGGADSLVRVGLMQSVPTVITGSGGSHFYYAYPDWVSYAQNSAGRLPGLDIRADGGFCVAPPTVHPTTGRAYRWVSGDHPDTLDPIPVGVHKRFLATPVHRPLPTTSSGSIRRRLEQTLLPATPPGSRNQTAARIVGRLLYRGTPYERIIEILRLWNTGNSQPLSDQELLAVAESMRKTDARRRGR